jgi:outer membrane beta-barrel protein
LASTSALALELKPDEIRGKSSKEPTSVLQNRYFTKSYRPEFGLMAGQIVDEAYLSTSTFGARAGLFFTEWLGMEVSMLKTTVRDSSDRKALNSLKYRPLPDTDSQGNAIPANGEEKIVSPDPEVNAIHSMTDANATAAPFYGKLNLLNKWIVYTDVYFTGGYSRVATDQGAKNGVNFGGGQRFYVGQSWSFRVDFRDRVFKETRAGEPNRKNSYSWDLGASYFFN